MIVLEEVLPSIFSDEAGESVMLGADVVSAFTIYSLPEPAVAAEGNVRVMEDVVVTAQI